MIPCSVKPVRVVKNKREVWLVVNQQKTGDCYIEKKLGYGYWG
uniref:Uncharacterized protein n=1 Tax=Utricularia reniformis TaxID=192314 RepID=A0A1Y0B4P6_9LAMI|nr:hypothetical protein AEK19_MT2214 [Utricularia reniformis]ART32360.1 hypothetical protein AEK19_MT2214 [Utricularia reniformis]